MCLHIFRVDHVGIDRNLPTYHRHFKFESSSYVPKSSHADQQKQKKIKSLECFNDSKDYPSTNSKRPWKNQWFVSRKATSPWEKKFLRERSEVSSKVIQLVG